MYDIVIVGASFAGITLAYHLPKNLKILIIDKKHKANAGVESTGLITQATYSLLKDFIPEIDNFIPNKITTIGVVAPNYKKKFFSQMDEPWIYSTDTPKLLAHMLSVLPNNIEVKLATSLKNYKYENAEYPVKIEIENNEGFKMIFSKFIVGADGAHSTVANLNKNLSNNKRFLAGLEKVFYGDIDLGPAPDATVYHFWFGEFSLGYGGWLSPTEIEGKKAFRLGLAKLDKDIKDLKRLDDFIDVLKDKEIIKIDEHQNDSLYTFGSLIPIDGVLKNLYDEHSLLLGDAAGFCGAFAADGIKGALVSGKIAAKLIPKYLNGNKNIFKKYKREINKYQKLITYFRKQKFYRWVWNRMKRDRTFDAMFNLVAREKADFLNQFCDSKDNAKSLMGIIFKFKHLLYLFKYAFYICLDILF